MKYSYTINGEDHTVVVLSDGSVVEVQRGARRWASVSDWKSDLPTGIILTRSTLEVNACDAEIGVRRRQMWAGLAFFLLTAYRLHKK